MKILTLLAAALTISLSAAAQSDYDVSKDKEGATVWKGECTFADMEGETAFSWLKKGADAYTPDKDALLYLRRNLQGYDLVVLMGTWCSDTQDLLPKLQKTLQMTAYPLTQLKMYGVDREKQAKYVEHQLYNLDRVPTIILVKNHTEVGRIVESAPGSIEKALAAMIRKHRGE